MSDKPQFMTLFEQMMDSGLPGPARAIYNVIAKRYNYKNERDTWVSHERLARDTGFSVSTVKRSVKTLIEYGWVTVTPVNGSTNHYQPLIGRSVESDLGQSDLGGGHSEPGVGHSDLGGRSEWPTNGEENYEVNDEENEEVTEPVGPEAVADAPSSLADYHKRDLEELDTRQLTDYLTYKRNGYSHVRALSLAKEGEW